MPEKDRLPGEITITPSGSSDEAIKATIAQLSRELNGLSNPDAIVEGESLPPISITPPVAIDDELTGKEQPIKIAPLRPTNSALGNRIFTERLEKKAA